jgi:putative redox protein
MRIRHLQFVGSQGARLSAQLDLPEAGEPRAYALLAHCFTCNKYYKAFHHIDVALTGAGIAVLRFDFTGLGESEGDFAATGFTSNVADLVAAAGFLDEHYLPPKLLIGHSLGGSAVLQAARQIPSSVAVATIGASFDLRNLGRLIRSKQEEIERRGEAEVVVAGRAFTVGKEFLDDLQHDTMARTIAQLGKALLVLQSPVDELTPFDEALRIFEAAPQPKSLVSLPGADHLLSDARDATYAGTILAAWAGRYLE